MIDCSHKKNCEIIKVDSDENSDVDDEIMRIIEKSGDENEFEGFGPEDIIDNIELLREIDLNH